MILKNNGQLRGEMSLEISIPIGVSERINPNLRLAGHWQTRDLVDQNCFG